MQVAAVQVTIELINFIINIIRKKFRRSDRRRGRHLRGWRKKRKGMGLILLILIRYELFIKHYNEF